MVAVVFLRVTGTDSDTRITFVCSKTRIAPLKKLTISRLETYEVRSGSSRIKELTGISLNGLFSYSSLGKLTSIVTAGIRKESGIRSFFRKGSGDSFQPICQRAVF